MSAGGACEDPWTDLNIDEDLEKLLDDPFTGSQQHLSQLRSNKQHEGFDNNAGTTWIYPSNLPRRDYQLNITQAALFRNTLVVLPTGLGKTFIAAVVMYNLYRWYPKGKIIFMAPTRPLVAQQIEACQNIMPFQPNDTVELTGKIQRARRIELWRTKRVFFATPQVVLSDIAGLHENPTEGQFEFPFTQVKLLVIDEAHKAKGRYAYNEVSQAIWRRNPYFRMLALSATPGRTPDDVAAVIKSLFISHLEIRNDTSIDVMPYVHQRIIKTIVVALGEDIKDVRDKLIEIIDPYQRQLIEANVLSGSLIHLHKNMLVYQQKNFRERARSYPHPEANTINTNFAICISLYHGLELLERHGLRVFLNNFEQDEDGRDKFVVAMDQRLRSLLEEVREKLGPNPFNVSTYAMTNGEVAPVTKDLDFGHPKFEEARSCLLQHFQENKDSRAIIFCEYRESVMLVHRLLLQHKPLIRPRCLVGQGGTSGNLRAITQKDQIQIMSDFRSGTCNVLISTCIGEEGLDVGEVDLIVCFDIATSNPTRFLQRIGRTGRKKNGKVIMLVTQGREQHMLQDVLANRNETNNKLLHSNAVRNALYQNSPRMVPTDINPKCVHSIIKPIVENEVEMKSKNRTTSKKSGSKDTKKKGKSEKQNITPLRKYFKKSATLDEDETEIFDKQVQTQKTNTKIIKTATAISATHSGTIKDKSIEISFSDINESSHIIQPNTSNSFNDLNSTNASLTDPELIKYINDILKKPGKIPRGIISAEKLLEDLKSMELPAETKLLILKNTPDIVRQAQEDMQIVNSLDSGDHSSLSREEEIVRNNYKCIESLFKGEEEIKAFLKETEEEECNCVADDSDTDESDDRFDKAVKYIFDGLDDKGINCDNFDYIQEQLKETKQYKDFMKSVDCSVKSTAFETQAEEIDSMEVCTTNSNDCTQWNVNTKHETSSTTTFLRGPIVKAFQQQEKKRQELSNSDVKYCSDKVVSMPNEILVKNIAVPKATSYSLADLSNSQSERNVNQAIQLLNNDSTSVKTRNQNASDDLQRAVVLKSPTRSTIKSTSVAKTVPASELDFDLSVFLELFPEECAQTETGSPLKTDDKVSEDDINKIDTKCNNKDFKHQISSSHNVDCNSSTLTHTRAGLTKTAQINSPSIENLNLSKLILEKDSSNDLSYISKIANPLSPNTNNPLGLQSSKNKTSPVKTVVDETILPNCSQVDSPVIRKKHLIKKRQLSDSDVENEHRNTEEALLMDEDSPGCEEIAATQELKPRLFSQPRKTKKPKKQRTTNPFLDTQAGVSGSSGSSDEEYHSQYVKDSMIVSSDEGDGISSTQMQCIYMNSVKSPKSRRGAFKMPEYRVYNDRTKIFSQAVPVDDSQYLSDSFVVSEGEIFSNDELMENTLCPLEKAEKILRERKRAKRQSAKAFSSKPQKKRVYRMSDSSDDG